MSSPVWSQPIVIPVSTFGCFWLKFFLKDPYFPYFPNVIDLALRVRCVTSPTTLRQRRYLGFTSHQYIGNTETGPRLNVSSEKAEE